VTNIERAEMILLMAKELRDSVSTYEKAKSECSRVVAGYAVVASDAKTAIERKILHMRQTLLDLGAQL
jgi:hypothetical protein